MHLPIPHTPHTHSPDHLRQLAVQRRASVSPSVARILADLAFGQIDRDQATMTPILLTGGRT